MATAQTSAVAQAERLLAASAAVLRLGALLLILAALPALHGSSGHPVRTELVSAAAAVESITFAGWCLRFGALRRRLVVLDLLAVSAALFGSAWPVLPGGPVESPLFNFALVSAVVAGLPRWPWWGALAATFPVVAATVAPGLLARDPAAPAWTLVSDGSAVPSAVFIAWLVARLVRHAAADYDRHRALTVQRAQALARERERVRQGAALRARLLVTLEEVVAAGAVTGPVLANQLQQEVHWLRRVVEVGLVDPPPALDVGLRALAAEKGAAGVRVALALPADAPALSADARHALLEATREALTNVAKHAGVGGATVTVTVDAGATVVEIVDAGRGYEPAESTPGTGQTGSIRRRLDEVGGTAEVHSAPGAGTRVVLRIPGGQR